MSFFRGVLCALACVSCVSLSMPPAVSMSVTIPSVLQPTSMPVVIVSGEPAPYDGALLTEGQLRMLKAQRDWLQGQVSAAYRLGRQEGEIVLQEAQTERVWIRIGVSVLVGLCAGAALWVGVQ